MSNPADFLASLAQALSALALYPAGHASRNRAVDAVYRRLTDLLADDPQPVFSFLGDEVVYGTSVLRNLKNWDWSRRLAEAGIQRMQFDASTDREELEIFLDQALARLAPPAASSAEARPVGRRSTIRFGAVGIRGMDHEAQEDLPTATLALSLGDEAEAVRWMHNELSTGGSLPMSEAEAVVRALSVAMHGDQQIMLPLLRIRKFDEYTTTHSINVSVLVMGLTEFMGMGPRDVRTLGVAGLLHDLGKVQIPPEILNKAGALTPEERAIINGHPSAGARLILESEPDLDLAAVVAYEHHIMIDGGGYPNFIYPRNCHYASQLVHVCDVYDALRTERPYRSPWKPATILSYIEHRLGTEFDAEIAGTFLKMMREVEARETELTPDDSG